MPEAAIRRVRCSTEQRRGRSVMDVIRRWVWVAISGRLSVERIGTWWPALRPSRREQSTKWAVHTYVI